MREPFYSIIPPFNPTSGCSSSQTSLGGIIASEPTAGVIGNRIVAFARGTDNVIYYQHSAGGAFSGWIGLAGGTYQSPKSTVINGTLYLEVVGTDNNNYYKTTTDGINFSNWIQGTGDAETTPLVDFNGYNYDFRRGDSSASQPALCVQQSPIPPAEIVSVEFDRFEQPDRLLDNNPGNGKPNTDVGLRIFPDKTTPTDNTNRAKVKVKATLSSAMPGVPIYFRVYDIDDPSDNAAPIDTTGSLGADNRGKVGTSSAGKLNVTSAPTNSFGVAEVELEVTKQPGDNFAVVASKSSTFLNGASINEQNIQVSGQTIPISGTTYSTNPSNPAIRTQTLTVWRKLHIEVDRMANVPNSQDPGANKVDGQFSQTGSIPAGTGFVNIPVNNNPNLVDEINRFYKGRIRFGSNTLEVYDTTATSVRVKQINQSVGITAGTTFIINDDDDYNNDDTDPDGDSDESINPIGNIFSPGFDNSLKEAYLTVNRDLSIYETNTVPFVINVNSSNPTEFENVINSNRGAASIEQDDFWVAYILLGYQSHKSEDYDGFISCNGANCITEKPLFAGVAQTNPIDCYCPPGSLLTCSSSCPTTDVGATIPQGGQGALIFQEVIRDYNIFYFVRDNKILTLDQLIIAHEIAHQFGIKGDNLNSTTFKIMDYPDYNLANVTGAEPKFHPQHLNIIRSRVKSPGEQ